MSRWMMMMTVCMLYPSASCRSGRIGLPRARRCADMRHNNAAIPRHGRDRGQPPICNRKTRLSSADHKKKAYARSLSTAGRRS